METPKSIGAGGGAGDPENNSTAPQGAFQISHLIRREDTHTRFDTHYLSMVSIRRFHRRDDKPLEVSV
jgi:hypothetical protein